MTPYSAVHQPSEFASERLRRLRSSTRARGTTLDVSNLIIHGECADGAVAHPFRDLVPEEVAALSRSKHDLSEPVVHVSSGVFQQHHAGRLCVSGQVWLRAGSISHPGCGGRRVLGLAAPHGWF
jgi:hypothetical protein